MAPLIGITCGHQWQERERYFVNVGYVQNILSSGGTPILIPYMEKHKLMEIMDLIDGLLIPGGIDIDPSLFGQDPHPNCGLIDPIWDELEGHVISTALSRDLPLLAICRGCQILNVVAGGDLIQDISSQVSPAIKHMQQAQKWHATHEIKIEPDSILATTLNTNNITVNSYHHQAVGQVASQFSAVAWANDHIVEAIESREHTYVLGVQWHPELMTNHHPVFHQLFTVLVSYANSRRL